MPSSVSRSSSRRGTRRSPSTVSSSSSKDQHGEVSGKKLPLRRSKSTASLPGSNRNPVSQDSTECTNMRDNPLFGCSSSSPSPPRTGELRCETSKDDVLNFRRGRSMSRQFNFRNGNSYCHSECGRSLSRDVTRRRQLRSLSRGHHGVFKSAHWEDKISSDSLSEAEDFSAENYFQSGNLSHDLGSGEIYEAVQFEVHSAASESITALDNAVKKRSPSIISIGSIVNIPAEFVNPDAIELVSDIRRDYSIKLEQSQERIRKLQADLAVEEQRRQELSKILENIVRYPKSFQSQAKKKASIERIKISRRLAEEAMNYFDECVSLSTFDGSDFSSLDDQHSGSNFGANPTGNSRFLSNVCSNSSAPNYPYSQLENEKDLDRDNKCSPSVVGSYDGSIGNCSGKATDLIPHNVHDDLLELNTPPCRSSFLYAPQRPGSVGLQEIRSYIKKFEKGKSKCVEDDKRISSYNSRDHISNSSNEALLFEKVMLRNRIYFGSVLVCQIRSF